MEEWQKGNLCQLINHIHTVFSDDILTSYEDMNMTVSNQHSLMHMMVLTNY